MSKGLKPMWVILEEKTEGKEHVTLVTRENICQSYTVNRKEISQCPNRDVGQRKLFSVSYWRYKTVRILKKKERERERKECMYTDREYPLAFTVWSWLDSNVSCQFLLPFFYSTHSQRWGKCTFHCL